MRTRIIAIVALLLVLVAGSGCSLVERAAMHGFNKATDGALDRAIDKGIDAATNAVNGVGKAASNSNKVNTSTKANLKKTTGDSKEIGVAQLELDDMGLRCGCPDRGIGPKTISSVKKFQIKSGLPVTGKLDKVTVEKIIMEFQKRHALPPTGKVDEATIMKFNARILEKYGIPTSKATVGMLIEVATS